MHKIKKAFTLVELLVVISIIAVIGAGGVALVNWNSGKQSLMAAQQTMMSAFEEARMLACAKGAKSRVLIYKGDDFSRKLRQIGIIYEAFDENGENIGWVSHTAGAILPKGVFFVPPSGEFTLNAKVSELYKPSDVIYSTFRTGTTGAPSVVGMANFGSRRPQSVGDGNGEWYCYEFSPEGLSENPSAAIILASGSQDSTGKYILENPYRILGFVVLRTGKTVGFSDYSEIEGNLKQ